MNSNLLKSEIYFACDWSKGAHHLEIVQFWVIKYNSDEEQKVFGHSFVVNQIRIEELNRLGSACSRWVTALGACRRVS